MRTSPERTSGWSVMLRTFTISGRDSIVAKPITLLIGCGPPEAQLYQADPTRFFIQTGGSSQTRNVCASHVRPMRLSGSLSVNGSWSARTSTCVSVRTPLAPRYVINPVP